MRRALLLLVVPILLGAGQATDTLTTAADALRRDPVYVHPDAPRALSGSASDEVRQHIRASGAAVFVAILPTIDRSPDVAVRELMSKTGLAGTYAAVIGDAFRASSTVLPEAGALATSAFQNSSGRGTQAVIEAFVDGVAGAAAGPGAPPVTGRIEGGTDDNSSPSPLGILLLAGGGGALLYLWSRSRRRQRAEAATAHAGDVQMLRAELAVLADDVLRLEPEVALHPDARDDYEAAVERSRIASAALDYADEPLDLVRVERVIAEGRYAMARAKAIVAGREPPAPPHELQRPGRHDEPALDYDDRGVPVYAGGMPFYGGGWFGGGGGGGLFTGLLLGSMLGGWGSGWGHGDVTVNDYGDGGSEGGGGFGGGDFGGGDWGGGDVGGGDW